MDKYAWKMNIIGEGADKLMEYIDILNEKGEVTGEKATREEVHKQGYWHRAIHVLLVNSKKEILLQKRSANKEKYPNLWDISCAGHLSSGDTSISGALREFQEELGIRANKENMKLIYTIRKSYIPKEGFIENEFHDVYLYKADIDIDDIKMQKEEVSEVKYVPFEVYAEEIQKGNKEFVDRAKEYKEIIEIVRKEIKED